MVALKIFIAVVVLIAVFLAGVSLFKPKKKKQQSHIPHNRLTAEDKRFMDEYLQEMQSRNK